jgi:hypothetical protein
LEERKIMDNKDFENIYKSSNQIDNVNNETFFVIRKALGDKFDPTSYAKVVSRLDFDTVPKGDYALYNGQPVFIQNFGSKSKCESIQKMVKYELNHFGIGKDW